MSSARALLIAGAALLGGGLLASGASAQKVNKVTPDPIVLTEPTADDWYNGYTQIVAVDYTMAAQGKSYRAEVSRSDPYATPLLGNLYWRLQGNTTWNTLSSTPAVVVSATTQSSIVIEIRKDLDQGNEPADTYTSAVVMEVYRESDNTLTHTETTDIQMTISTVYPYLTLGSGTVTLPSPTAANFGAHTGSSSLNMDVGGDAGYGWTLWWRILDSYANPMPGTPDFQACGSGAWDGTFLNRDTGYLTAEGTGPVSLCRDLRTDLGWASEAPGTYTSEVRLDLMGTAADGYTPLYDQAWFDFTITIGTVLAINLGGTTAVDFGTASASGYQSTASTTSITHEGNVSHRVEISADGTHMTSASGTNDGVKPSSDLEWTNDGGTNWTALSTTGTSITSVAAGSYTDAETIGYRMLVDTLDPNDTYTVSFTYSVIAN